jgi:hypothetical protein
MERNFCRGLGLEIGHGNSIHFSVPVSEIITTVVPNMRLDIEALVQALVIQHLTANHKGVGSSPSNQTGVDRVLVTGKFWKI